MARKFKAKPFKNWLDTLAKVVVKARDDYTCQKCPTPVVITNPYDCQWAHVYSRNSNIIRWDLLNALTLCGHCHQWGHSCPVEFGVWFAETYPARQAYLIEPIPDWSGQVKPRRQHNTNWKEDDFKRIEAYLLQKAVDFDVDYMRVPTSYRARFKRLT